VPQIINWVKGGRIALIGNEYAAFSQTGSPAVILPKLTVFLAVCSNWPSLFAEYCDLAPAIGRRHSKAPR
jgi:hypothetical protein